MSPHRPIPYRNLPLPRTMRSLLANPGAFFTAVSGLVFLLVVKVLLVRGRPTGREPDR